MKIGKINSKKGNTPIAIGILTILIVLLFFYSLFVYITRWQGVNKFIVSYYALDDIYSQEEQMGYYLNTLIENAFIKTYYDFTTKTNDETNGFMKSIFQSREGEIDGEISQDILDSFNAKLRENIKKINNEFELEVRGAPDYSLYFEGIADTKISGVTINKGVNENIADNRFELSVSDDAGKINMFRLKNFKLLKTVEDKLTIDYYPEIYLHSADLHNLRLNSLREIKQSIKQCSEVERNVVLIRTCFEGLEFFDVDVEKRDAPYYQGFQWNRYWITLTSKKTFFIDQSFKKIKISFELWRK